jgi:hypothetical protein
MIVGCGIVGLLIFLYMLVRGTSASDQINMEIGIAIAALAATIGLDMDGRIQLAVVLVLVLLFVNKGFAAEKTSP